MNQTSISSLRFFLCALVLLFWGSWMGCGSNSTTPPVNATADGASGGASTQPGGTDRADASHDDAAGGVPDGTAEDLFRYAQEIEYQEFSNPDYQQGDARNESIKRVMEVRIAVCDKILSFEESQDRRISAVQMKLDALRTLFNLEPDGAGAGFVSYVQELSQGADPLLARLAKVTQFQATAYDYVLKDQQDTQPTLSLLSELLSDADAGYEVLLAARDAADWLYHEGQSALADQIYAQVATRFASSDDPTLVDEAQKMNDQAAGMRLTSLAHAVISGTTDSTEPLEQAIAQSLGEHRDDDIRLAHAMQAAQMLEFAGSLPEAKQVYQQIGSIYQEGVEASRAENVKRSIDLAVRRIERVGQPMALEGVELNGQAYDPAQYQGKDLLVLFWTTWYEGLPGDIEVIRDAVRPYLDRGLEVVTVNLDDDRNGLERYLRSNPMPWPVLVNPDPTLPGFANPNAERCGLEAVPFTMLIGRDGNVAAIHLMGDRLTSVLAERYPPVTGG